MEMLFALGVFHGVNPGMGWLFAVALALQEGERRALWRALAALGAGHALAIGAALAAAAFAGGLMPPSAVRAIVAVLLVTLGASRLVRMRHPRAGGMRVGMAGLTGWSFLMASAHGAGLMVLPFVLDAPVHAAGDHAHHVAQAAGSGAAIGAVAATAAHGAGYLAATAIVALIVYEKVGVSLIRRAWINLDAIWAAALIATGVVAAVV